MCCARDGVLRGAARRARGRRSAGPARRHARAAPGRRVRDVLDARARRSRAPRRAARGRAVVVLVPGNHDHALIGGWLAPRTGTARARAALRAGAGVARSPRRSRRCSRRRPSRSPTPGCGCADGVYAMHGHYLDLHMTVPTIERLAVAVSGRLSLDGGRRWNDVRSARRLRGGARAGLRVGPRRGAERAAVGGDRGRADRQRVERAARQRGAARAALARASRSPSRSAVRGAQRRRARPAEQRDLDGASFAARACAR